jgi:hypothetical protein
MPVLLHEHEQLKRFRLCAAFRSAEGFAFFSVLVVDVNTRSSTNFASSSPAYASILSVHSVKGSDQFDQALILGRLAGLMSPTSPESFCEQQLLLAFQLTFSISLEIHEETSGPMFFSSFSRAARLDSCIVPLSPLLAPPELRSL